MENAASVADPRRQTVEQLLKDPDARFRPSNALILALTITETEVERAAAERITDLKGVEIRLQKVLDRPLVPLLNALWARGIPTASSCCSGHVNDGGAHLILKGCGERETQVLRMLAAWVGPRADLGSWASSWVARTTGRLSGDVVCRLSWTHVPGFMDEQTMPRYTLEELDERYLLFAEAVPKLPLPGAHRPTRAAAITQQLRAYIRTAPAHLPGQWFGTPDAEVLRQRVQVSITEALANSDPGARWGALFQAAPNGHERASIWTYTGSAPTLTQLAQQLQDDFKITI